MATVPVMINGVLFDKQWRTSRPVVVMGEANIVGLEVGGGPIYPEGPGSPPGVPTFPIWGPPGVDWPSGPGYPPSAQHPIVIPPPPTEPPTEPIPPGEGIKPPPAGGGWGYSPTYGWGYFPGVGGKPQPPGKK